jgi:hypothetical protein
MLSRQLVDVGIPADFYHSHLLEVAKSNRIITGWKVYLWDGILLFLFCESSSWFTNTVLLLGDVCHVIFWHGHRQERYYGILCFLPLFDPIVVFLCQQICDLLYTWRCQSQCKAITKSVVEPDETATFLTAFCTIYTRTVTTFTKWLKVVFHIFLLLFCKFKSLLCCLEGDAYDAGFFPETERLKDVMNYCENTSSCRMYLILQQFGESCSKKACNRKAKCENCRIVALRWCVTCWIFNIFILL